MCLHALTPSGTSSRVAQQDALQQQQGIATAQNTQANDLEAQRQGNIVQGENQISSAFNQFDPSYYDKYNKAYTGYYTPQLNQQFSQAKGQLRSNLAETGTLNSTAGAEQLAQLDQRRAQQEGQVSSQAQDAVTAQKNNISNAETGLFNLAQAGGDPSSVAARAVGTASTLVAPQAFTPLGSVFGDLVSPVANALKANAGSLSPIGASPLGVNAVGVPSGGGTSVVRS